MDTILAGFTVIKCVEHAYKHHSTLTGTCTDNSTGIIYKFVIRINQAGNVISFSLRAGI